MIALACVLLVISGLVLMISQGVGPFARDPWEDYYFRFRKTSKVLQTLVVIIATLVAIISTLILIGIIPSQTF